MDKPKDKKYWASLAQYENDPQFLENSKKEFLSSPLQEEEGQDGFHRRDFMKLMAASTALASSACFQRPMHKILPYVNQPEEITFGIANYYASTCTECEASCGTLVKTREGRPIKLEGNPDHPMNKGGLCARGQASILNLYDPDRLRYPVSVSRGLGNPAKATWTDLDKKVGEKLKAIKAGSGQVRLLTGTITSPTTLKLIKEFLSGFKNGQHIIYDPISTEAIVDAQELSYGTRVLPRYRFENADVIVSIDADFLGTWISPVEYTKGFSKNRKVNEKKRSMSKLIAFESVSTVTGSNADERIAIKSQDGAKVAMAIAYELLINKKVTSFDAEALGLLKAYSPESVAASSGIEASAIKNAAHELWAARGKGLVVGGSAQSLNESALSLQIAVNLLNSILQNDGRTVDYAVSPSLQGQGRYADLLKLIKDMQAGSVDALLIWNSNPMYTLPKTLKFEDASKKVGLVVSFNDRVDETGAICDYVLPDNHSLEAWGDAQPQKNLYSLVQPTIRPIYDTRAFQDSLLSLNKAGGLGAGKLGEHSDFHAYLQSNWRETIYKDYGITTPFASFWESALRDGVFDGVAAKGARLQTAAARSFKASALKGHLPVDAKNEGYELAFYAQVGNYDGRHGNNSWLQELPDPITRMTWDNYASVSPAAAAKLHLKTGDMVKLGFKDNVVELPAVVQPGQNEKMISVALGYGRSRVGDVGNRVGQNMFALMDVKNGVPVMSGFAASIKKTGAKYMLASIQDQHSLEGRPIVKEATLKEYKENPHAGNEEHEELTTIWSEWEYKGYRWGMSIDLNSCTGCSACVLGCQSENNVPVVGKGGVVRGRIMHWIRIDRYYTGTPDNPQSVHQPMLCQHCENAPCETVCPVIATAHDDEGLNQQIYNRCVGTRYCANNCPYKVRRFNWFEYNYGGQIKYPLTLAQNPEVTVRSRGVMEKCTFCVQRIQEAKNTAKDMGRTVKDGEIKTACQQSCPADAITFGNINDKSSAVVELASDPRGYHVLEELNVRPSITYLTKIRNAEETT